MLVVAGSPLSPRQDAFSIWCPAGCTDWEQSTAVSPPWSILWEQKPRIGCFQQWTTIHSNAIFFQLKIPLTNRIFSRKTGRWGKTVTVAKETFVQSYNLWKLLVREAPPKKMPKAFGHCSFSNCTPPHSNGHSFLNRLGKFTKSPFWRYISASILASLTTLLNTCKCPF